MLMSAKNLTWVSFITILIILLANDAIFYFVSKKSLTENLASEMETISNQISLSVDNVESAMYLSDTLVSHALKNTAIAIRNDLPSSYNDVTNEKLVELAEQLNVTAISLFARNGEDIVVVRSSEPRQIGLSSKGWGDYFTAFNQLFNLEPVTVEGVVSEHYWSGKISGSSSNPESLQNKYGYYFDGSTNYIINPYIDSSYIQQIEWSLGANAYVRKTLDENKGKLLAIAGFNPRTFALDEDDPRLYTVSNGVRNPRYSERRILFGSNEYADHKDLEFIEAAIRTGRVSSYTANVNGYEVLKTYFPVTSENVQFPYVIGITSSMDSVQKALHNQLLSHTIIIAVVTAASIIVGLIVIRGINRVKNRVAQDVQDNYTDELNSLLVAVKGQRHDFNNHLDTLHGLIELECFDEAKRYINDLAEETVRIHEVIDIGHPGIAALIQSKLTQSIARHIDFTYEFRNLAGGRLDIVGVKSVDVVKILGNLLDNAFDEVLKLPEGERTVFISGEMYENELRFAVKNKLHREVLPEAIDLMFRPKQSSKNSTGIGLSIVKERVTRYRGGIHAELPEEGFIQFNVWLPITLR